MDDNALAKEVFDLLTIHPSGLLSDIDGTLSRIVNDPAIAQVDPEIWESLAVLVHHVDVVGVITGRSVAEASRMMHLEDVICIGNHGMERLENGEVMEARGALAYIAPLRRVLDEAKMRIADPRVVFENKGITGSIHYRNAGDPAAARDRILEVLAPLAEPAGLRLSHGRMVIELRPPIDLNKGTALAELVEDFSLRSILFMGDDVTDLDAMRAVSQLRVKGKVAGLSIGVIGPETPGAVATESDRVVTGVDGVRALLAGVVDLYTQQSVPR